MQQPQADPGFLQDKQGMESEQLGKAGQNLKLKRGTCPREGRVHGAFSTLKRGFVLAVHGECLSWLPPPRAL